MNSNADMFTMQIEIKDLTKAQAIAIEDMLAYWVQGGQMGCSRWMSFFADGDGNFHPRITIDGEPPKNQTLIDPNRFWTHGEPWKGDYKIDFDAIAWKLHEEPARR